MLAVLSPSLNRMMVSFSIFVNLVIVNLHTAAHDAIQNSLVPVIGFHLQLHIVEEAAIPLFYALAVQLVSQSFHDFLSGRVGNQVCHLIQTIHRCFTVGAAKDKQDFLFANAHFHKIVLLEVDKNKSGR